MSLYSKGARDVMTIGADFQVTKYRSIADEIAKAGAVANGVIAFEKNNPTPSIFYYTTGESAADKYDSLADNPGKYVYIYLYKDKKPVDEAYFVAQQEVKYETKVETKKERVGLGWILGGVALGMLGLSMGFRQRKG